MQLRVDTSARGYRYMSRAEQAAAKHIEWLGTVAYQGEVGALGLEGGRYYLYSSGRKPIELPAAATLHAIAHPEYVNPRGRKPGPTGLQKPHSVTMDVRTRDTARDLGEGNLSLGIRLAVEYVATQIHPQQFEKWKRQFAAD